MEKALPEFRRFARSEKERDALFAMFLENHVLPTALSRVFSDLRREEFEHPETIFYAKGAMESVPFPDR